MIPTFSVPPDSDKYCDLIKKQCLSYIQYGIWDGITEVRLERWLSNFETQEEQYFGCRLLDHLVYRSEEQVISMLKQLFQVTLPNIARAHKLPIPADTCDCSELFSSGTYDKLRLVAAFKPEDPPSKSAAHLARLMKRSFGGRILEELMIFPPYVEQAKTKGIKCFVFFDDFLGTGEQFKGVLAKNNLRTWNDDEIFVYAPLVGHAKGIEDLGKEFPNLIVCPVEILTSKNQVFDKEALFFDDGQNSGESAKAFYYEMIKRKKLNFVERRGFGNLELAFTFSHAVPDNCLPIFWDDEDCWQPLFQR